MKSDFLPVFVARGHNLRALTTRLSRITDSGQFSNFGPQTKELEDLVGSLLRIPSRRVVTAANATLALTGVIQMLSEDSVAVPAYSFVAGPLSVISSRKTLVVADISRSTLGINIPEAFEGAILHVGLFGSIEFDDKVRSYQGSKVADFAAGLGNAIEYGIENQLSSMDAIVFSLHATKVLGAAEGSVVVFSDESRADTFRSWTNFGFSGQRSSQILGTNAKLSELNAAAALSRLDTWRSELDEWLLLRSLSIEVESELGLVGVHKFNDISPYWVVDFGDKRHADHVMRILESQGIETRRWWGLGISTEAAFEVRGSYPNAGNFAGRLVGLPFWLGMGREEFSRISIALEKASSKF